MAFNRGAGVGLKGYKYHRKIISQIIRNTRMKGAGMLVVSLRGVVGKRPLYLAVFVSFRVALEEVLKNIYFLFVLFT